MARIIVTIDFDVDFENYPSEIDSEALAAQFEVDRINHGDSTVEDLMDTATEIDLTVVEQ